MNFIKRNILSENDIKAINKFLRECEWVDGFNTAPGFTYYKKIIWKQFLVSNILKQIK